VRKHRFRLPAQRGYALITSLVFLVVLTLVAVTAIQGTTLELKMSNNEKMRTEAFYVSDTPRQVISRLIDIHTFARGWSTTMGGTVPDSDFNYDLPAGYALSSGANWYEANTESDFDPNSLDVDATLSGTFGDTGLPVESSFAVYKLRTAINPGSGSAMVAGYEGTGKAVAASGGSVYFFVNSIGKDSSASATSETAADYRHIIRN